ncbi:hypothetical protein GH714_009908 [Hevea brasiliensis]|uniref:Uncharacterized protein n=1 Tax=Hevea brasiliensis TaxID=3981 RepID=A0A6A6MHG4_HEVBR|nr:hypothetical protein GH714_009908 [Hevea brasiliensis]
MDSAQLIEELFLFILGDKDDLHGEGAEATAFELLLPSIERNLAGLNLSLRKGGGRMLQRTTDTFHTAGPVKLGNKAGVWWSTESIVVIPYSLPWWFGYAIYVRLVGLKKPEYMTHLGVMVPLLLRILIWKKKKNKKIYFVAVVSVRLNVDMTGIDSTDSI